MVLNYCNGKFAHIKKLKMKKLVLFSLLVLVLSTPTFAQKDNHFTFSVGAELGFATGSFSETHSVGIGGSAQIEIPIQDKLQGTGYIGILSYNGKSYGSGLKYKGQTIVPVRVGIKYFLSGGIYGGLQAGVGFLSNSGGTAFSYSPQIGYEFKTKSGKAVDATFKYDAYSKSGGTLGALGLRLAYIF